MSVKSQFLEFLSLRSNMQLACVVYFLALEIVLTKFSKLNITSYFRYIFPRNVPSVIYLLYHDAEMVDIYYF